VHFFHQKVDDLFIVVILNTHVQVLNLPFPPTPTLPAKKFHFLLCLGMHFCLGVHLKLTPINYAPPIFSPPWGVHVNPVYPLAAPMFHATYIASSLADRRPDSTKST